MNRRDFAAAALAAAGVAIAAKARAAERPNILWLTSEDNNIDWVGCYGNPRAETPNIDRLAAEGFLYRHCYANAPVCAPSRSTWITGMLALSIGTHPMRSRYEIPHQRIQYYPDYLRAAGYRTGNEGKTDYNIGGRPDKECWCHFGKADWSALKKNQPFFQVVNSTESHESRAQGDVENTRHDPANTRLRAYHPDLPDVRKNYAKYHDAMKRMDAEIGASLDKLEQMGLSENTIVVYNSDHGGVLPRSKRYLFGSGLHCPLVVRIPERFKHFWPAEKPGMEVDRLVSFVDMPKTWLSLAGVAAPAHMQGKVFLGPLAEPEPGLHFAFRGRMDERIDNARAVCDKRFLYIRNYMPYAPWMQHLQYLWRMKATAAWERHVREGLASEVQARFFAPKGWTEELYDMRKDPDNVDNLAANPEHAQTLARMRAGLRARQMEIHDAGLLPESEMVRLAAANRTTIYELARHPGLYNLPALLDAADLALARSSMSFPLLARMVKDPDLGIRYWGAVGCLLVTAKPDGFHALLEDESHEVRALAAWLMARTGERDPGIECLERLLRENSYAMLSVLNIIDWMGADGEALLPVVETLALAGDEKKMQANLLAKRNRP